MSSTARLCRMGMKITKVNDTCVMLISVNVPHKPLSHHPNEMSHSIEELQCTVSKGPYVDACHQARSSPSLTWRSG